jgi:hypothetical protein
MIPPVVPACSLYLRGSTALVQSATPGGDRGDVGLARAVVPPPRLRASPLAFDADDAGVGAPVRSAVARECSCGAVTRIDAAKWTFGLPMRNLSGRTRRRKR